MIETSIVDWIELGDSMQTVEIYRKKKWLEFFKLMRTMTTHKNFSILFYFILKVFYFLQIIMLNTTNVNMYNEKDTPSWNMNNTSGNNANLNGSTNNEIFNSTLISFLEINSTAISNSTLNQSTTNNTNNLNVSYDNIIKILYNISTSILFVQETINDGQKFKFAIITNSIITLASISCLLFIYISLKFDKFLVKFPISILNILNIFLLEYLIGPSIQISLMAFKCTNGTHDFLNVTCLDDRTHIFYLALAIINLIYFFSISIILTIFFYEIGSINKIKVDYRLNSNAETLINFSKASFFVFAYFLKFYANDSYSIKIIFQLYILFSCAFYSYYFYMHVLFFNEFLNNIYLYGWIYVTWFSLIIFFKTVLGLHDISIFVISGWIILTLIVYTISKLKEDYLLQDFNIFESKSLKEIVLFCMKLFSLINSQSFKDKTLLAGKIKKFEENISSYPETLEKYRKLTSNVHLKKKYNNDSALNILAIIYLVYHCFLENSNFKIDILFNFCYFLAKKLKNNTYAVYLLSKIKSNTYKQMYLKYLLMDDFKINMLKKLTKSTNKESIKRIQLGSVILFNNYCQLFKDKIYELTCNQLEYYEILKNSVVTPKTTENFLKLGEEIINNRKSIMGLWNRMVELNPFNEESFRDLTLYLRDVVQDELSLKEETKKINGIRSLKFTERNNTYYNLFNPNNSFLLVDGYSTFGKILYHTPNFPGLFGFSGKEVLNLTIDDLCPQVIKEFHNEIIFIGIQYTNLGAIFSQKRDLLLRGKSGNLHWIKIFIKFVPNLSHGVIYILDISKVQEKIFNILLDKDFKISAFTDSFSQTFQLNEDEGYVLDRSCINCYLALIIPEILLSIEFDQKNGFHFTKEFCDLKGTFYNLAPNRYLNEKVNKVLVRIKTQGRLLFNEDEMDDNEYIDLLKEIKIKCVTRQSVFFKIIPRIFSNGRHRYYKVVLSDDFIVIGDDENLSGISSNIKEEKIKDKKAKNNKKLKNEKNNNEDFNAEDVFLIENSKKNLNENENEIQDKNSKGIYERKPKSSKKNINYKKNKKFESKIDNLNKNDASYLYEDIKKNITTQKIIKIKINNNGYEEEHLNIHNEEKKNFEKEKENKKFIRQNIINEENEFEKNLHNQKENISYSSRSSLKKNYLESSSFNKLKNGILAQKEISSIKYLRLLAFFFGIGMIILVTLSSNDSNLKFSNLEKYISQNLFFNHSKIAIACVYFTTLNLKLIKNEYFKSEKCLNISCKDYYESLLEYCAADIKSEKQNSFAFSDDFKNVLFMQKEISLIIRNTTKKNTISISVENLLNLIVSFSLTLKSNINDFLYNAKSAYDATAENILEQTIQFIEDELITGLNKIDRQNNFESKFTNQISQLLIFEIISFFVLISLFVIFICRIFFLENNYIRKLVYFKNAPFELYLKNLENLKKNLRNDIGEQEEENKINNEIEANNNNNNSNNISERFQRLETQKIFSREQSIKGRNNNQTRKQMIKDNNFSDNESKKSRTKRNNRKNASIKNKKGQDKIRKKSINLLINKANAMGKYFLKENISFFVKILIIFVFSSSYYFLVNIIDKSTINSMLEFDTTNDALVGVYKESIMIYLKLKTELSSYIKYEKSKLKAVKAFNSTKYFLNNLNKNTSYNSKLLVDFDGKYYSDAHSLLNSKFYKMNIPTQINSPKIGTLLMPITNTDITVASPSIVNLNKLYNSNACAILFDSTNKSQEYKICSQFWSGILLKGMEQSITQMSVFITGVIDDLNSLNYNMKNLTQIISDESVFSSYEKFIQIYLLHSYFTTVKIFRELSKTNLDKVLAIYKYITISYITFVVVLYFALLYIVFNSKIIFNRLMNFIVILPTIYIMEDSGFYKAILKLEENYL